MGSTFLSRQFFENIVPQHFSINTTIQLLPSMISYNFWSSGIVNFSGNKRCPIGLWFNCKRKYLVLFKINRWSIMKRVVHQFTFHSHASEISSITKFTSSKSTDIKSYGYKTFVPKRIWKIIKNSSDRLGLLRLWTPANDIISTCSAKQYYSFGASVKFSVFKHTHSQTP
jgi:hypothetical protein